MPSTRPAVIRAADAARYLATDQFVWFDEAPDVPVEELIGAVPPEHRWAVDVGDGPEGMYAGIYGVRPMELGLPSGRLAPVAGLTWVGVHPDHRRRGLLTALLRHHLEQAHREGLALSALHASEPAIYPRFGYGLAALELQVDLGRGTSFTAPGLEERVSGTATTTVTGSDPGVASRARALDLRLAAQSPGIIVGSEEFYTRAISDRPHELRDKEQIRLIFAVRAGEDVGCASFRRTPKWDNGRPGGTVTVGHLGGDPAARLALLRRLVDLDLTSTITLSRVSPDDPLFAWVGGPRGAADVRTYDSTYVRLVDLASAWAARGYDSDCDIVVDVADRHAPWNAGRWRLLASGGEGTAERTDAEPDLSLDVNVLGAGYLGRSIAPLLRAGIVTEHRGGALGSLAEAMRTELAPEPSTGF